MKYVAPRKIILYTDNKLQAHPYPRFKHGFRVEDHNYLSRIFDTDNMGRIKIVELDVDISTYQAMLVQWFRKTHLRVSQPTDMNASSEKTIVPRIITGVLGLLIFALIWFGIAGRLTWWQGWAFLLTFTMYVGILTWRVFKLNPELFQERNQPAEKAEPWDRVVIGIYTMILLILLAVVALDGGRNHWSSVPPGIQLIGWLLLIFTGVLVWHVMMTNAYLSSWARLQDDREQVVVEEGAYGHIRHPMYLGIIMAFVAIPLAMGSWWAMIPGIAIGGIFVYRTYREDLMLVDGLSGYAEYSERVPYRLLPGIW